MPRSLVRSLFYYHLCLSVCFLFGVCVYRYMCCCYHINLCAQLAAFSSLFDYLNFAEVNTTGNLWTNQYTVRITTYSISYCCVSQSRVNVGTYSCVGDSDFFVFLLIRLLEMHAQTHKHHCKCYIVRYVSVFVVVLKVRKITKHSNHLVCGVLVYLFMRLICS